MSIKNLICQSQNTFLNSVWHHIKQYGKIDVLVNNAGINFPADFDKQTDKEWNEVLDVNLTGVFRCCQEILPYISDYGRIINIGSTKVAGVLICYIFPNPVVLLCLSKWGFVDNAL